MTGYEYRSRTGTDFRDSWVVISGSDASTVSHRVTGLTNGTAYVFELRAVNSAGVGAPSVPVRAVPLAVPLAPEGVMAEPEVAAVTLRWTRTTDPSITGYEYTTDGSTWVAFPSGSAHYRVTGLTNGQEYTFRLRALNARGAGAISAAVVATPDAVPGVPGNLQANAGNGQVMLTWEAPASGGTVKRYEWRIGEGIWADIANSDAMTTSHVATGLTNGQSYQFQVRAGNDAAVGSAAQVLATPTMDLPITISAIADFTEFPTASRGVIVTATHRDSTTALRYRVEPVGWLPYGIRVGPTEATDLVSGASEVTITNPGRRVGVVVTVRVIVTGGTDEAWEDFRAVFTDDVAPFVEPLLRARAGEDSGTVELMWSHAGRQRVTGYQYKQGNGAWTAVPDSHVDTTSHVVRGLSNGTSYTFQVRALNARGMGPASNAATASALGRLPAPDGLAAKSGTRGVSSFTVQWTAVSNATGYVATAVTAGVTIEGTVSGTEAAFANLLPIRGYTVSVYATGDGTTYHPTGRTATVVVSTLLPPRAPEGLAIESGAGEVTLRWTQTTDASVTGYEYRSRTGADFGDSWVVISGSDASTVSHRVTGLTNGTAYVFELRAVNSAGVGAASVPVRAVPLAVPSAPEGVMAEPEVAAVTLRWTRTTDPSITGYEYTTDGSAWVAFPSGSAHYRVTGLTNGQEYTFRLRALNARGAGAISAAVTATPDAVPGVPGNLQANAGNGQVALTWEAPASGGTVKRYEWRIGEGIWTDIANSDAMTTSHVATGLTNGQSYQFQVRAANDAAVGSAAQVLATPTMDLPITISAIADFTEFPTASRGVIVTATHRDSTTALRYRVEPVGWLPYGIRVGPTEATDLVSGASEVTITNPGRRVGVVVTVRVIVTGGTDEAREDFRAVFTDNVAPFVEPLLRARAGEDSGAVELMWSHAGRQRVTGYQYKQGNGAWTAVPDSHVDTTSHVVRGLNNGTSYTFQVRALNARGMGPASNAATASALGRLPAPDGLAAKSGTRGVSSFTVQWTAVSNATGYVATAVTAGVAMEGTVSGTEAAFANLLPIRAYTVSVYATGDGTTYHPTGRTATVVVSTLLPPRAPEGLAIESGAGEVTLRWTRTTDAERDGLRVSVPDGCRL